MARAYIKNETEVALFAASKRRCCICAALHGDYDVKEGQIAHLNRDASDPRLENLVWLCLHHHDRYDSTNSQTKGLTLAEVRYYRDALYERVKLEARPAQAEVDFLRAYFRIIDPDVRPGDQHSDILYRHLNEVRHEVQRLRKAGEWRTILEIRVRLREYFEYSGRYDDGWEFGYAYADALRALELHDERRWVLVKDVAYMLILGGKHARGREEIEGVLEELASSGDTEHYASTIVLTFYAHRYLGISFQRAPNPDRSIARHHFDAACNAIHQLPAESRDYRALNARIIGNFGNLAFDDGDFDRALELHRTAFSTFKLLGDLEHIGIANLNIAKTLIHCDTNEDDNPLPYLFSAQSAFSQIAWLEGLGRVHEQLSRWYLILARSASSGTYADRALDEARTALGIFERMHSGRLSGRIEPLIEDTQSLIAQLRFRSNDTMA